VPKWVPPGGLHASAMWCVAHIQQLWEPPYSVIACLMVFGNFLRLSLSVQRPPKLWMDDLPACHRCSQVSMLPPQGLEYSEPSYSCDMRAKTGLLYVLIGQLSSAAGVE
jgi:hypothetical protein